jgi:flagellar biosynthesis protein FlhF
MPSIHYLRDETMELKTFRARSMQDALALVRSELGPDAAVLHTREVRGPGFLRWLSGMRQIEVTASARVQVPSRLPERLRARQAPQRGAVAPRIPAGPADGTGQGLAQDAIQEQLRDLQALVEDLRQRTACSPQRDLPESLFLIFTDMIEADVSEEIARDLIERVRHGARPEDLLDPMLVKSRIAQRIEREIAVAGPIHITPGRRSMVALVGPTGVGKTTTIAKLAAHFRLREKKRVGLITVDTYRIAAVEQLRTYADIIDLPMEVVSTPREMRAAAARLADLDLVLMDTAGRSPRDDVQIQQLKSMLAEAKPDEVHLVLSSVGGARNLASTAEKFAPVGITALVLTKLDEATGVGNLLSLLRDSKWRLSYLTDGQNVPDDIRVADARWLARKCLNMDSPHG